MRASVIPLLTTLMGCAPSVMPEFHAHREAALADPGPAPSSWSPDASVRLSAAAVDDLLDQLVLDEVALGGTIDAGLLTLTPRLALDELTLGQARKCEQCLRVDTELSGDLVVDSPLGRSVTPLDVSLSFDSEFAVQRVDERWQLTAAPKRVRKVEATLGKTDLGPVVAPLKSFVEQAFADLPPQPVADLGGSALPLRAMRVVPDGMGLRLDLLTDAPTSRAIPIPVTAPPDRGWELALSSTAVVALAQRASFDAGAVAHDIVPEPTSLTIDGDRFTLGLRLWRIKGRGWWRDYTVSGTVSVAGRDITLSPDSVEDGAHSPGAAWADPLAALGKGVILKTIERALETSLPAVHRERGADQRIVVQIDGIEGSGDVLLARGSVQAKPTR